MKTALSKAWHLNEDITMCIFEQLSIDRQAVIPELALIPLYILPLKVNLPSLKLITSKLHSKESVDSTDMDTIAAITLAIKKFRENKNHEQN